MFITLSIISTVFVLSIGLRKNESQGLNILTLLVVLAQMIAAFAEFGFLGGLGVLVLATAIEGGIVTFLAKGMK